VRERLQVEGVAQPFVDGDAGERVGSSPNSASTRAASRNWPRRCWWMWSRWTGRGRASWWCSGSSRRVWWSTRRPVGVGGAGPGWFGGCGGRGDGPGRWGARLGAWPRRGRCESGVTPFDLTVAELLRAARDSAAGAWIMTVVRLVPPAAVVALAELVRDGHGRASDCRNGCRRW